MHLIAALAEAYHERQPAVTVEIGTGLGTTARLQALAAGKIDIALAIHGIAFEEIARHGMTVHEIATVAVVFGVNARVPLTGLTNRQIWRTCSSSSLPAPGPDTEVDAEVVRAKIGCLKDLEMAGHVKVMPQTGDMAQELAVTPGAIGMTPMTVVEQRKPGEGQAAVAQRHRS